MISGLEWWVERIRMIDRLSNSNEGRRGLENRLTRTGDTSTEHRVVWLCFNIKWRIFNFRTFETLISFLTELIRLTLRLRRVWIKQPESEAPPWGPPSEPVAVSSNQLLAEGCQSNGLKRCLMWGKHNSKAALAHLTDQSAATPAADMWQCLAPPAWVSRDCLICVREFDQQRDSENKMEESRRETECLMSTGGGQIQLSLTFIWNLTRRVCSSAVFVTVQPTITVYHTEIVEKECCLTKIDS